MASKRPAPESGSGGSELPPAKKTGFLLTNPIAIGPVSTEEELDIKVLKAQNARLYATLEERKSQEEEFKGRLARLERIRKNDQNIISSMNISWNQLDEDVTLLLQRFQDLGDDLPQGKSETTVAFLEKLSNRTTKGIQEELGKRVMHTGNMVRKLVVKLEAILVRSKDVSDMINAGKQIVEDRKRKAIDNEEKDKSREESDERASTPTPELDRVEDFDYSSIELAIRQESAIMKNENKRLHDLITEFHDKHAVMSSEFSEIKDNLASAQKENAELLVKQSDMEYDLQKATKQFEKLIKKLSQTHEQSKSGGVFSGGASSGSKESVSEELEAKEELAKNRLSELEKLHEAQMKLTQENERLKQQVLQLPDEMVTISIPYKTLQTQFNLLYNDAQVLRKSCEDARRIVVSNRSQHLLQIEQLETEYANGRKKVRAEVAQLEKALTESRKELELLRVEYEHNMKAHEQIGPMAKEMRHLINSLQNHNQQLKGEVQRFKRKLVEAESKVSELEKTSRDHEEARDAAEYIDRMETLTSSPRSESSQSSNEGTDCDDVKVLRTKLKSAREKRKEMKLLLDMYKGVSKETRDKVELLKNEKTLKDEVASLKSKLLMMTEDVVRQSRKIADVDHIRQCRKLEGKMEELQKTISNMKQEEDALLAEMEFTGQAFEEMQEQNIRLMQQLREKDDANLKLMSERIKSTQIQKLLREEKDVLIDKVSVLNTRHQVTDDLAKRLEEREKVLQTAVSNMEKENNLRQQAIEVHKRKAVDLGQQYQELAGKNEMQSKQFDDMKKATIEKANVLEEEMFKCNRMMEENTSLKKKLDKAKRMEFLGASDEILVEECKMYKSKLTCPCCNTRAKDAILTKCFHVFCFECLKTRYDTRQRKCPKCNATFGNNDFHKIYM